MSECGFIFGLNVSASCKEVHFYSWVIVARGLCRVGVCFTVLVEYGLHNEVRVCVPFETWNCEARYKVIDELCGFGGDIYLLGVPFAAVFTFGGGDYYP